MKVLFAVNDEKDAEAITRVYQKEYKEIISSKTVYYFNAIIKELQKDKTYDRIVISEDLEMFASDNYQAVDNFIFEKMDAISDEATNADGSDIPIILLCMDRRTKNDPLLVRLFGLGLYNVLVGQDRSVQKVAGLMYKPRTKKEAKMYYKVEPENVTYSSSKKNNEVSESEIQNILNHYKKIGNNISKCVQSFDSIVSQYNKDQVKVIASVLPNSTKVILEENSDAYRKIMGIKGKKALGSSELRKTEYVEKEIDSGNKLTQPVIIPTAVSSKKVNKVLSAEETKKRKLEAKKAEAERIAREKEEEAKRKEAERIAREKEEEAKRKEAERIAKEKEEEAKRKEAERLAKKKEEEAKRKEAERIAKKKEEEAKKKEAEKMAKEKEEKMKKESEEVTVVKRGRGRPRKNPIPDVTVEDVPIKRKRGRPRKVQEESLEEKEELKKEKIEEINSVEEKVPVAKKESKRLFTDEDEKDDVLDLVNEENNDDNDLWNVEDSDDEDTFDFDDIDEDEEDTFDFDDVDEDEEEDTFDFDDEDEDEEEDTFDFDDEDEDEEEDTFDFDDEDEDEEEDTFEFDDEDEDEDEDTFDFDDVDEDEDINNDEDDDDEFDFDDIEEDEDETDESEDLDSEDEEDAFDFDDELDDDLDDDLEENGNDEEDAFDFDDFNDDEEDEDEDEFDFDSIDDNEDKKAEETNASDEEEIEDDDLFDFSDVEEDNEEEEKQNQEESEIQEEQDDLENEETSHNGSFKGILNKNYKYDNDLANSIKDLKETEEDNKSYNFETDSLITSGQKLVSFVGTTKNGTSFIVNNLAEILSNRGIKTAILDLTKNKNSYYIYTNNEDWLREKAQNCLDKLKDGTADGIEINKNLAVYTSLPSQDQALDDVTGIIKTLLENYTVVLLDCDFDTDVRYFRAAQEIYLVQSLDVLTIQPLTAFLRDLKVKNILDTNKLRVVINKNIRVNYLNDKVLIGGMSVYNDPAMTYMTELFNKDTIKYTTIPFEDQVYTRYLEALVNCKISTSGYSKNFISSLNKLGDMVFPTLNGKKNKTNYNDYSSQKKNFENTFSKNTSSVLNKMKKKY